MFYVIALSASVYIEYICIYESPIIVVAWWKLSRHCCTIIGGLIISLVYVCMIGSEIFILRTGWSVLFPSVDFCVSTYHI